LISNEFFETKASGNERNLCSLNQGLLQHLLFKEKIGSTNPF